MTDTKNRTFNLKKESIIGKTQPKLYHLNLNKNNYIQKKEIVIKNKNNSNANKIKMGDNSNNKIFSTTFKDRNRVESVNYRDKSKINNNKKSNLNPNLQIFKNFSKSNNKNIQEKMNYNQNNYQNSSQNNNIVFKTIVIKKDKANQNYPKINSNKKSNIQINNNTYYKNNYSNNIIVKIISQHKNNNKINHIKVNFNSNIKNANIINNNENHKLNFNNTNSNFQNNEKNKILKLKNKNSDNTLIKDSEKKQNEKEKENIEKEKSIIYNYFCPKCNEKAILELNENNFTVKMNCLIECLKGNPNENIPIKEFKLKNQLNKQLICFECRNKNTKPKDLYYCSCHKTLCPKCKNNQIHKNHFQIFFSEKGYYCFKHHKKYECYCEKCKINICIDCVNEHNSHNEKIFNVNKIKPTKREIKSAKDDLRKQKEKKLILDEKYDKFIETLKNKKKEIDLNFEEEFELKNNLINKMDDTENINYEDILNFKNLKLGKNNKNIINDFLNIKNNFVKEGKFLIGLLGRDEIEKENKNNIKLKPSKIKVKNEIQTGLNSLSIIQNKNKKKNEISNITNFNYIKEGFNKIKNNVICYNIDNFNIKGNLINQNQFKNPIKNNVENNIDKNIQTYKNINLIELNQDNIAKELEENKKNIQKDNISFNFEEKINSQNPYNIKEYIEQNIKIEPPKIENFERNKKIELLKNESIEKNKVIEAPKLENVEQNKIIETPNLEKIEHNKIIENSKKENYIDEQNKEEIIKPIINIIPEKPKELTIIEKIENCETKLQNKDERCITSLTILRNNKILITFKGGILKFYEFEKNNNINTNENNPEEKYEVKLKELLRLEEDEYCFNYGIELYNGNVAVCSEDGTVKIIKLFLDENLNNNEKHRIIQIIYEKNQDPIYTIKELSNHNLVLGCWKNILIYQKSNEYEYINKLIINDYSFCVLELSPNEIISSHSESKTLTIHNLNTYDIYTINNIESNENNNIICKYNNQNEIVFVAYDKGINIVSIINKCLIKKIELKEIISGLSPMIIHLDIGNGKIRNIFGLLCGAKRKVYGEKVNFAYSLLQLGFNINDKDMGVINTKENKNIDYKIISRKDRIHYYDITNIINSAFCKNKDSLKINENKEEQWIFSSGNEDKRLNIWKI